MAHLKSRSDSFIARLDRSFETWLEKHLPLTHRLIRYLLNQLEPIEDPKSRRVANLFVYFLMGVAVLLLILSLVLGW